jgi:AraC-like DNA-binding protein
MFREELRIDDKIPVNIRIASLENYPLHYHPDVEFIFVLQGRIRLLLGCNDYLLEEGSVFVCNGNEVHSMIGTDQSNTVALIQVNNNIFSKYYPNLSRSCYRTNTVNPRDERLNFLRRELTELLLTHATRPHGHQQTSVAIGKKLLSYLEVNFNYFSVRNKVVVNEPLGSFTLTKRMSRVILNIYENHYRKLSIGELSKKENLSSYYLSHCIRKHIGLSYRELLSFARVESSQVLLLNQALDLKDVYEMVGFSASQYFEQHFQFWFNQTPHEYRETFIGKIKTQTNREVLKELSGPEFVSFLDSYAGDGLQASWSRENPRQNGLAVNIDALFGRTVDFMPEISVDILRIVPRILK